VTWPGYTGPVTEQIDAAVALLADDDSAGVAVAAGSSLLARDEGAW
jgi:hypothetical protein